MQSSRTFVARRTLVGGSAHQTRNGSDLHELLVIASDLTGACRVPLPLLDGQIVGEGGIMWIRLNTVGRSSSDMQVLHAVTEHQMVAAFLAAELNSPRWREHVIRGLAAQGREQSLIEHPDLQSDLDNDVRVQVLGYRGYQNRELLFSGFPRAVEWWAASVPLPELRVAKVINSKGINSDSWPEWAGPGRHAGEAARTLGSGTVQDRVSTHIKQVRLLLEAGKSVAPLLLVGPSLSEPLVILEGHVRTMAALLSEVPQEMRALVGVSPEMAHWYFY